jgi:AcrR family transcriptional regulator
MTNEAAVIERPAAETRRREQAKRERRDRIVEAACDLLRDGGVETLSMKVMADRAGVSQSTVYNLYGSKQAVLAAVFDRDLINFARMVDAAPSANALERIFDSVDIAADLYRDDPDFYRATMWGFTAGSESFLKAALRAPRVRFWRDMIARARDAGQLRPSVDPAVLGALVVHIFDGVLADWIRGDIDVERLRTEAKFGFAVALGAFAAQRDRTDLRQRAEALHEALRG